MNLDKEISIDAFLGGRIHLKQYKKGYRATSDSVLLSAGVRACAGDSVLDVGTAGGVILFCMAQRLKDLKLTGVDIQEDLLELAKENARENNINADFIHTDIFDKNSPLNGRQFHHVVTNPPFYDEPKERESVQQNIAFKAQQPIGVWVKKCLKYVRPKGTLTIIHRPQALFEILEVLEKSALGAIEIIPIQSMPQKPANRIIVRGILNSKKPLVILPPLITHTEQGSYTQQAESILRENGTF